MTYIAVYLVLCLVCLAGLGVEKHFAPRIEDRHG